MKTTLRTALALLFCAVLCFCLVPAAFADTIASGTCGAQGDNLTWTLYDNYELVIEGSGDMEQFYQGAPWGNYRQQITSLSIGNGVTSIGNFAFSGFTNLPKVVIPASVVDIGYSAFNYCQKLSSFEVETDNPAYCSVDGYLYSSDMKTLIRCPGAKTGTIVIPNSVKYLGTDAFGTCSGQMSVIIPEGVETIGQETFFQCTGLTEITLPNSLTTIGPFAFQHCKSLTNVTIPAGVTNIERGAFTLCDNLVDFVIASGNPAYCVLDGAIYTSDMKTLVCYPCGRAGSLTIPNGVTQIGQNTFQGSRLTNIVIPDGITEIDFATFTVSNLKTVTIPASVTKIDVYAFNCRNLTDVFFSGTEEQWNAIEKEAEGNDPLFSAAIHYNVQTVTINYDANGGEGVMDFQMAAKNETCTLLPNTFTNGDLIFASWNTEPDGSGVSYSNRAEITPVEDMTLYAQWAKKITVSYYKNDETPFRFVTSAPSNNAFNLRTLAQLEEIAQRNGRTFLRPNYEFVGWSLTPDAAPNDPGIIPDGAEVTFEDDTSLYAQWVKTKVSVTYYKNDETSLRFVASGPCNIVFNLRTLAYIEEIAQRNGKTFLRAGYEFVGWSLTPDAAPDDPGIIQDGAEVTFEDDTSLYAQWKLPIDETTFPDETFRSYVSENCDKDKDSFLSRSEIDAVIVIDCSGTYSEPGRIASLKGIEFFSNLRTLKCSYNCLTELDVHSNAALEWLVCSNNRLTELDVSQNAELLILDVGASAPFTDNGTGHNAVYSEEYYSKNNQLTALDVSHNLKLRELRCVSNQLTELDVSHNGSLSVLDCRDNCLTSLDMSHNPALQNLSCGNHPTTTSDNQFTELDLSNNPLLSVFECSHNQLKKLDLINNPKLGNVNCGYNQLTELDVSSNPILQHLHCSGNQLTELTVINNPLLKTLWCDQNQLTELDISSNAALDSLCCADNIITSLNISRCPSLVELVETIQPYNHFGTIDYLEYYYSYNVNGQPKRLAYDESCVLFSSVEDSPDFVLPDSLNIIGESAFEGGAFTIVRLSDTTEKIETRAFANCPKIAFIIVPPATTDIAWDAFDGDKGLIILGVPESRAETYAAERGLRFAALP